MRKILAILTVFLFVFTNFSFAQNETIEDVAFQVLIDERNVELDVKTQLIDGRLMIPLRFTLEEMGFEVKWNSSEDSVELINGAIYTKLYIGNNSYFKNKMAPFPLSTAPIIINGRTLVPIEFFHAVLDIYFQIENRNISFYPDEDEEVLVTHMGYVSKIVETPFSTQYHLSRDLKDEIFLIINSTDETIIQKTIDEGDLIKTISLPIMLMSYPGQTGAIVIY